MLCVDWYETNVQNAAPETPLLQNKNLHQNQNLSLDLDQYQNLVRNQALGYYDVQQTRTVPQENSVLFNNAVSVL